MPSVGPLAAGYRQNANAYLTIVSSINFNNYLTYTGGAGSGGAFNAGSFSSYPVTTLGNSVDMSTGALRAGNTLRDMGRTVISSSRVFRKVQVMALAANPPVSGGSVAGIASDYLVGYLEVAGDGGQTVNALARTGGF